MEYGSDLTGRMQEFLTAGGGMGVLLVWLGVVLGLTLAFLNKRKWMVALFLIFLTFSGIAIAALDSGSTLLRWGMIFLLGLTCISGMKFPGSPAIMLGIVGLLGLVAGLSSVAPMYTTQRSGLLIVFATLMAAAIAHEAATIKDVQGLIRCFNIAAGVFMILGLISLRSLRAGERFSGSNAGAPLFVLTGGLLLPYAMYGAMVWKEKMWRIYCVFLTGGLLLLCLISGQRTGTFAGIIGCLPLLSRVSSRKLLASGMVLAICAGIVVAASMLLPEQTNFVKERFVSTDTTGRAEIWQVALEQCLAEPWFGHGIGMSILATRAGVHNAYLAAWYDTGVLGLVLFVGAYLLTAWRSWRLAWQRQSLEAKELGRLLLGVTVACLAAGFFEESIFSPSNMAAFVGLSSGILSWRLWAIVKESPQQVDGYDWPLEPYLAYRSY